MTVRYAALVVTVALTGCIDEPVVDCDMIEREVLSMDTDLIKITGARETSRADHEVVCHGTAVYKSSEDVKMRYRVYRDEDGDDIVAYDTDEAEREREAAEERETKREIDAAVDDMMDDVDRHMRDNMPPGAWDRMQQQAGGEQF